MSTHEEWIPWNKERERFREQETSGWEEDMHRLDAHIEKLLEVAPKDKAGFPVLNALDIINLLRQDFERAKIFWGYMP